MGTRSSFMVIENWVDDNQKVKSNKFVNLYMQFDGYPEGNPSDVAKWLSKYTVVNGLSLTSKSQEVFNGAGCLAAQFVHEFKNGAGGIYLFPINHFGRCWEEYLYEIIVTENKKIIFKGYENNTTKSGLRKKLFFEGTPQEFTEKYQK